MKQVTLMDLLDSSIFNTNSLAPTLYLSESDENYLNRENNNGRIFPKEALNDAAMQQNEKNNKVIYYPFG